MATNIIAGCVADNNEKYLLQALRLLQSWRWFAGDFASAEFIVAVVDRIDPYYQAQYERYAATVVAVPRFCKIHQPSNKLRFLELPQVNGKDAVLLLDCDTLVVREPMGLFTIADLTAKISDVPTVSHAVFSDIFSFFGLPLPAANQRCTIHGEAIIPYFNSGVLAFSADAIKTLAPEWIRLNRELVNHIQLLQNRSNFCDQASLSLAVAATGTSFVTVGNEWNFPAHFRDEPRDSTFFVTDPAIIHYHWLADQYGMLESSPYPNVDLRIQQFNDRLRTEERSLFTISSFWNNRYLNHPELGSGIGSRGGFMYYKRALLEQTVKSILPDSILDVGCGDMEVSQVLPANGYVGVDISHVVIAANSTAFQDRKFITGHFIDLDLVGADLIVCLDILIHLSSPEYYKNFVRKCVALARKGGIISGYELPPVDRSVITFFHEPLSLTLAAAGAKNVRCIGAYRQVKVFRFDQAGEPELPHCVDGVIQHPIFLVGTMRSGTTLLGDMLGQSPHIALCPFELKDIWSAVSGIPMASPKTRDLVCPECSADDILPAMRASLSEAFSSRMSLLLDKADGAVFLNKNPHLCNKLQLVQSLFPDARFIWIHRDLPRVVASIKRLFATVVQRQGTWHWWPLPEERTYNRCWNAFHSPDLRSDISPERIFPGGRVTYIAEYWLETNRAVSAFLQRLPAAYRISIKEEELVVDPLKHLATLAANLETPYFEPTESLCQLDLTRNNEWINLLDHQDILDLIDFVNLHVEEIDGIFSTDGLAHKYLSLLCV